MSDNPLTQFMAGAADVAALARRLRAYGLSPREVVGPLSAGIIDSAARAHPDLPAECVRDWLWSLLSSESIAAAQAMLLARGPTADERRAAFRVVAEQMG